MRRCPNKHRRCWLYGGKGPQVALWCYECGAIRFLPEDKKWTYPVGTGGLNPAMVER